MELFDTNRPSILWTPKILSFITKKLFKGHGLPSFFKICPLKLSIFYSRYIVQYSNLHWPMVKKFFTTSIFQGICHTLKHWTQIPPTPCISPWTFLMLDIWVKTQLCLHYFVSKIYVARNVSPIIFLILIHFILIHFDKMAIALNCYAKIFFCNKCYTEGHILKLLLASN